MNVFNGDTGVYNGFVVNDSMRDTSVLECPEGSEVKFFIIVGDKRYLVKDSSFNRRRKRNSLAPYCEYVGSNFIRFAGLLDCQKCYLGKYHDRDVVLCEDIFNGAAFRPFKDLHQSSAGTDLGTKEYVYSDVLYILKKKSELNDSRFNDFKSKFWLMYLFDAILGNRDRHEGNWGFIKNNGLTKLAPIFDNGASLFPDADLSNWNDYDFIKTRVFIRPASQFKLWKPEYPDRAMRTNYYETISDYSEVFQNELDMVKKLDFNTLIKRSTVDVPLFCKEWFTTIIYFRFKCLILGEDYDKVWEEWKNDMYT